MKKKDKAPGATIEAPEAQTPPEQPLEGEVSQAAEGEGVETPATGDIPEASAAEWQAALELAVKQRDELKNSLLRAQADFQNFKRRNQTARSDGYEDGVREAIAAMLPAIDNLERAIAAAEKTEDGEAGAPALALAEGVKMTLNTLFDSLKRFGFEEVPALGEPFDPELHNAVMREATDDPGKVLEVFQKGYRVKDKIIRYAMVKVSVE